MERIIEWINNEISSKENSLKYDKGQVIHYIREASRYKNMTTKLLIEIEELKKAKLKLRDKQ